MDDLASALIGPAVGAAALTAAFTFLANVIVAKRSDLRKHRGLTVALLAEIKERRRAQQAFLDGTDADAVKSAMDNDPDYFPFTTSDPDFSRALYDDLRKDVSILEVKTLEAVVRFYIEDNYTQVMVIDLRSPEFKVLTSARKKAYLDLLLKQSQETIDAGNEAVALLEGALARK